MQELKYCYLPGHSMMEITGFCIFMPCLQASRWVCHECEQENIHAHESRSDSHLISLNLPKIQVLQRQIDILKKLINEIQSISNTIHNLIQFINIHQQYKDSNQNISLLSDQQLNDLSNVQGDLRRYRNIKNNVQSMLIQLQNLDQNEFQFEKIHQQAWVRDMGYPSISQNEKYLGFTDCYNRDTLNIRSLTTNKCLHYRQIMTQMSFVRFSNNSKCILVVDDKTNLLYYSVKNNLKLLFRINLSERGQQNKSYFSSIELICINDREILVNIRDIILFDIFKKRNLLKIRKQNQSSNMSIEYDKVNNYIITSEKSLINFYERNSGNSIINQNIYQEDINSIQLINESQNLITTHIDSLRSWNIDHQKKSLTNERCFKFQVFYSQSIQFDKLLYFIIRNENKLLIIDEYFGKQYQLYIQGSKFDFDRKVKQYMSLNFIIIQDQDGRSIFLRNKNIRI